MAQGRLGAGHLCWRVTLSYIILLHLVVAQYPPLPSNADVFSGSVKCSQVGLSDNERNVRITLTKWPTEALLVFFEKNCAVTAQYYKTLKMAVAWVPSTRKITLTPIGTWIPFDPASTPACALGTTFTVPILTGTLGADYMTLNGNTNAVCGAQKLDGSFDQWSFAATRKIGWESKAANEYGALQTCIGNTYQSSLVVFGCPAVGNTMSGSTQVTLPAKRELMVFEVPNGLANFSLSLTTLSSSTSSRFLDLKVASADEFQWFSFQSTNSTFSLGTVEIACFGDGASSGTKLGCNIPETPVAFSLWNTGGEEAVVEVKFTYEAGGCTSARSNGCSALNRFYAQEAIFFWSRSLRANAPTKTQAYNLVANYMEDCVDQTVGTSCWAIPWYKWYAAFNKPLSWSWTNGWNDWSFAWSMVFKILDVNQDGYISLAEYEKGYDMQAPVCPATHKRNSPVILGCSARSAAEAKFAIDDPPSRKFITLMPGTKNMNITITAPPMTLPVGASASELYVYDARGHLMVGKTLAADIHWDTSADPSRARPPSAATVGITVSYTQKKSSQSVGFSGAAGLSEEVDVLQRTVGIDCATVSCSPGLISYHHGTSCSAGWSSGCDSYDPAMGRRTAQLWGYMNAGAIPPFDAFTDFRGFLPWFNWFGFFKKSMANAQAWWWGEVLTGRNTLRGYEHMFRYADDNTDGYISRSELELLQNVKVKYCSSTYYQSAYILFGSSYKSNKWLGFAGTGCGSYGEQAVDVTIPARKNGKSGDTQIATLPAGLQNFQLSSSSPINVILYNATTGGHIQTMAGANAMAGATLNYINTSTATTFTLQGTTTASVRFHIRNDKVADQAVRLTFQYDGLTNCMSPPLGCSQYDNNLAKQDAREWSNSVANLNALEWGNTAQDAWAKLMPYRTSLLEFIPPNSFQSVWCKGVPSKCSVWMRGFVYMDSNYDSFIDLDEFTAAYNLAGTSQMVKDLIQNGTCMPTNQHTLADFPLQQMPLELPCHCSRMVGEGWNGGSGICMKRSLTQCSECENQAKCASMATAAGHGLRDFDGDCAHADQVGYCVAATKASLSFPVAIAIDEENHIYIADYGNNRIRMVSASTGHIATIAGSGHMGFSGDGGEGKLAKMRHPEGIAVNKRKCSNKPREVYFSDFFNQRIRKVTLVGSGAFAKWTIQTVLGTGERGENSTCDMGCVATSAILNNPRGLAFSFDQDLYIVDSGNRKIRRYDSASKTMSTFIGLGTLLDKSFGISMKVHEGWFLSGHWEEQNRDVALGSIYNLQIDGENNLWFSDTSDNRMYMAPIKRLGEASNVQSSSVKADGYIGRYLEYYRLHFQPGLKPKYEKDILSKLEVWLALENPQLFEPGKKTMTSSRSTYKFGKSYWKFGSPLPGLLCKKLEECEPQVAQFQKFSRLFAHCFDAGNNMFLTDQTASQIVQVAHVPTPQVSTVFGAFRTDEGSPPKGIRFERRNCPCFKNWIDWEAMGWRKPKISELPGGSDVKAQQVCNENTDVMATLNLPKFMQKPCTVANFCSQEAVPWCFVNAGAKSARSYCGDGGGWGYCPSQGDREVNFKRVEVAAILGHEMRNTARCTFTQPHTRFPILKTAIQWHDRQVNRTYPCDDKLLLPINHQSIKYNPAYYVLPWSQLLGFEEPNQTAILGYNSTNWQKYAKQANIRGVCDGLAVASDSVGTYCVISSPTDFDSLMKYASAMSSDPTYPDLPQPQKDLVNQDKYGFKFGIILVWSSPRVYPTTQACEDRCKIDSNCKAYVSSPYQASRTASDFLNPLPTTTAAPAASTEDVAPYTCMLYSETWPYSVYTYSTNASSKWSSAFSPVLRMFNFDYTNPDTYGYNNAYINTNLPTTSIYGHIGGPYPNRSLLLGKCKEACAADVRCASIAFPGCYMFNSSVNWTVQGNDDKKRTDVYIKEYTSLKVERVTGAPEVYAFSDNINADSSAEVGQRMLAQESLVNRPAGCAFNSKGELFFADTWNHRIRKIGNMHVDCQYNMALFTPEAVKAYRKAINDVNNQCFTNTSAPLKNESAALQEQVVQKHDMKYFEQLLCKNPSPHAKQLPTQNLLVLCSVCAEIPARDQLLACPSVALCNCRTAIVKALSTEVYLNCPASSAYYEKWHRFISAYVVCWFSQGIDDAHWQNRKESKDALKAFLARSRIGGSR